MRKQRRLEQATVEIVRVLGDHLLTDSVWWVRRYSTGGDALRAGIYVVLRPAKAAPGYDAASRYLGPCPSRSVAEFLKVSAMYLGAEAQVATAECEAQEAEWQPVAVKGRWPLAAGCDRAV